MNEITTDTLTIFADPAPQTGLPETLQSQQVEADNNVETFSFLFTNLVDVENRPPIINASQQDGPLVAPIQMTPPSILDEPLTEVAIDGKMTLNISEPHQDQIEPINTLAKSDKNVSANMVQVNVIPADTIIPVQDIFVAKHRPIDVPSETVVVPNIFILKKETRKPVNIAFEVSVEKEPAKPTISNLVLSVPKLVNLIVPMTAQNAPPPIFAQSNAAPTDILMPEIIPKTTLDKAIPLANVETGVQLQIAPQSTLQIQSNFVQPNPPPTLVTQVSEPLLAGLSAEIETLKSQVGNKPKDITVQLSPAELGRVQIRFSFDGGERVVAHIAAENPETLIVLRQKSDMLAAQLKLGGFDNVDLNFDAAEEKNSEGAENNKNQHRQAGQNLWNLEKRAAEMQSRPKDEIPYPASASISPLISSKTNQDTSQIDIIL